MQFYINYLILHNQSSVTGYGNPLFNTILLQLAVLGAHYRICKKSLFIKSYIMGKLAGMAVENPAANKDTFAKTNPKSLNNQKYL